MAKLSQAGAAEIMELGCLYMNVIFDLFLNTECVLDSVFGKKTNISWYWKMKVIKEKLKWEKEVDLEQIEKLAFYSNPLSVDLKMHCN